MKLSYCIALALLQNKYISALSSPAHPNPSFTKQGDIHINPCQNHKPFMLFPSNIHPLQWVSCGDAYEYTWSSDFSNQISGLNEIDRLKLSKSMGFCPNLRCQLDNVSGPRSDDICPVGLCYTKIENGGLSFGACCYHNNSFVNSQLIGYYNKSQQTPKPIYRHSRLILGSLNQSVTETYGYETFINANFIYSNKLNNNSRIIATQCPMNNTITDIKQMLLENNVSLWIALAPNAVLNRADNVSQEESRKCHNLPYYHFNIRKDNEGVSNLEENSYVEELKGNNKIVYKFTLTGYSKNINNSIKYIFYSPPHLENWRKHSMNVTYVWYSNWQDFHVPPVEDEQSIYSFASSAANVIKNNGTMVISCLSGRGRTGTFAAVTIGIIENCRDHHKLTNIIVSMREKRDGMVETPAQYRFVAKLLKLSDPSKCSLLCYISKSFDHSSSTSWGISHIITFILGVFVALVASNWIVSSSRMNRYINKPKSK
eukprot:gene8834-11925_t